MVKLVVGLSLLVGLATGLYHWVYAQAINPYAGFWDLMVPTDSMMNPIVFAAIVVLGGLGLAMIVDGLGNVADEWGKN